MLFDTGYSNSASSLANRLRLSSARSQLEEVGARLSTGERSMKEVAKTRDLKDLYTLDRAMENSARYKRTISFAGAKLEAMQVSLGNLRSLTSDFSLGVLSTVNQKPDGDISSLAQGANATLKSVVGILNGSFSGESLFSGAALDSSALNDSGQIVSDVEAIFLSAADVNSALAAVDFYFDDPSGGFATTAYTGSLVDGPSWEIGDGQYMSNSVRADNPALKESIKNLTLVAVVENGVVNSGADEKVVLRTASERGLQTTEKIVRLQQSVGMNQEGLNNAKSRLTSIEHTIQVSKGEIVGVDLFSEASKFEQIQAQMEASYKVTSVLSSLSLANFIR